MQNASRTTKLMKEVFAEVEKMVKEAGGTAQLKTKNISKHPKIIITINGHQRTTPLSKTPKSASECMLLKKNDVRRIISELKSLPSRTVAA